MLMLPLFNGSTLGDAVIDEYQLTAAGVISCGEQHSVARNAGKSRWREVGDDDDLLADELLGRILIFD